MKWIVEGNNYYPTGDNSVVIDNFPKHGVYQVNNFGFDGNVKLGLSKLSDSGFNFDFKIYDTSDNFDNNNFIDQVNYAWNNRDKLPGNLGIILNGLKGTGKTILAKLICNKINIPVVVVNKFYRGIDSFLQNLNFECIVFLDEAEKVFNDENYTLFNIVDGSYNVEKRLCILTTNNLSIDKNLLGRPGRIRYVKNFSNLPKATIDSFINDNLLDISLKEKVIRLISTLKIITIDIVKCIVEEANIFGNLDTSNALNISKSNEVVELLEICETQLNETSVDLIKKILPKDKTLSDWLYKTYNRDNLIGTKLYDLYSVTKEDNYFRSNLDLLTDNGFFIVTYITRSGLIKNRESLFSYSERYNIITDMVDNSFKLKKNNDQSYYLEFFLSKKIDGSVYY